MNKTMKKVLSVICAIALVVTSMTGLNLTKVLADSTTTTIATGDEARAALLAEVASADYNFALGKNASVSQLTTVDGGTNLEIITNGSFATANSKDTIIEINRGNTSDFAWVQVDLGNAYDVNEIDRIAVQYKTNGSSPRSGYTISYSLNGIDFVTVAEVGAIAGGANQIYLDQVSVNDEQAAAIPYVRFVRVTSTKVADTSNYGMQVKGMAVLTDGTTKVSDVDFQEVEKLDDVKSITVTSSDYGQLEFKFEAAAKDDGYTYVAYVDGTQYGDTVVPGTIYTVTNLSAGEHRVKIVSIKETLTSDGITEVVTVTDTQSLLTTDRNFAIGKSASASSIRDSDVPSNAVDGKTNTLFRTATTDTTASVTIDLGDYYKVDAFERIVALYADNRYPVNYTVEFSVNGIGFQTVATGEGTSRLHTALIDLSACTLEAVKYVRFNFSNPVAAGYGFQMNELGLITKEDADLTPVETNGATLDAPESLTVTSSYYCKLEYVFEGAKDHDDYEYYAFVNGAISEGTVEPGTKYSLSGLTAGEYEVKVISYKDGEISEALIQTIQVLDYTDLIADERNIAVGKVATPSSIRVENEVEDDPTNLTDGDITTRCRTATVDTTSSIVIDLGAVYKIGALERVLVMFVKDRGGRICTVECSLDNEVYEQVGRLENISGQMADIELDATKIEMTTAQYIKLTFNQPFADTTGFQILEIAIIEDYTAIDEVEVADIEAIGYTGEAIEPELTLTYKEKQLVIDKDYEVVYENNTEVGTAKVTINGLGRYTGSVEKTFEIVKQDMANVTVNYYFDEENELVVGVANGNVDLTIDVDYTYVIGADEDGNITITATAMGDSYTGETVKTIELEYVPVNEAVDLVVASPDLNTITVDFANADKLGAASQTYDIYIDDELVDEAVAAGTYTYDEQTVGSHTVKVVADLVGNKSQGVSAETEVAGVNVGSEDVEIIAEVDSVEYTGFAQTIGITVKCGDVELVENVDYTVVFADNTEVGYATYTITGIGLYEGTVDRDFEIVKKNIKSDDITVAVQDIAPVYSGSEITVGLTITYGKLTLEAGVDYSVSYSDNINAGKATYEVTGIGSFEGTISGEFIIVSKGLELDGIVVETSFNANKELVVVVKDGDKVLVEGTDYSVSSVTDASYNVTVTVTALEGNYSGTKTATVAGKDNPNAPEPSTEAPTNGTEKPSVGTEVKIAKVKKLKTKKINAKKVKLTWKKIASANGYEVRYSTSKKMKNAVVKTVKKNKAKYTVKKLKGKKYYIQVRAYVLKDGDKLCGKWSKAKKVKMK